MSYSCQEVGGSDCHRVELHGSLMGRPSHGRSRQCSFDRHRPRLAYHGREVSSYVTMRRAVGHVLEIRGADGMWSFGQQHAKD